MDNIYFQLEGVGIVDENGTTYQNPVVEIQVAVGARGGFLQMYMQPYSSLQAIENRLHPLFVPNFPYSFVNETTHPIEGITPPFLLVELIEHLVSYYTLQVIMKSPVFLDGVGVPYSESNPPMITWRRVYLIFKENF